MEVLDYNWHYFEVAYVMSYDCFSWAHHDVDVVVEDGDDDGSEDEEVDCWGDDDDVAAAGEQGGKSVAEVVGKVDVAAAVVAVGSSLCADWDLVVVDVGAVVVAAIDDGDDDDVQVVEDGETVNAYNLLVHKDNSYLD